MRPKAARLALRPLETADAASLLEAVEESRPALKRRFRWTAGVVSPEQCADFVTAAAGAERAGRELVRGAFAAKDGAFVGIGALQRLDQNPGTAELALWVRSGKTDKGYAQELGRALIQLGFKGKLHRLFVRLDPTNRAARQVLKKLRFKYEGCLRRDKRLNNRWIDQECWGLLKEDL